MTSEDYICDLERQTGVTLAPLERMGLVATLERASIADLPDEWYLSREHRESVLFFHEMLSIIKGALQARIDREAEYAASA